MTTPDTPNDPIADDLAALKAAIDAGPTPGEWVPGDDDEYVDPQGVSDIAICSVMCMDLGGDKTYFRGPVTNANRRYIAAANPARIARLIAALEAARVDAERYRFVRTADKVRISSDAARDPVVYDAAIDSARGAA